jgi:tetratricopeptide (TPR) repeat protein
MSSADEETPGWLELARSLNDEAARLFDAGSFRDGLVCIDEAIALHHRHGIVEPWSRFDLAASLHNQSLGLAEVGQREEAVRAAAQAVAIVRELATDELLPVVGYLLATMLGHIAGRMIKATPDRALNVATEAVRISRRVVSLSRLAEDSIDPGLDTADDELELDEPAEIVLAIALNNLSLCLSHPSRRKERIAVIEETVEIYRRFTELDPNRWESRLAEALNNLGTALHAAGRPADALRASQESVRRFQDTNAPLPDLAGALSNHSTYLFLAGRHGEALKAIEHSVTAYEALIQSESDRYAPDHQRAANILSALLNGDSPFR